ncbi:MAG TPA: helix-turn-helix domain-containing protein, partial [Verrucomicrobiae bacterium]|nr:helix-turn-helix domain-containing protein [Verrucomicrobiae bacterium]
MKLVQTNLTAVARQRRKTLEVFAKLRKKNKAARAAAIVGSSMPTLWRWRRRYAARGLAGLNPKLPAGGRPSPFSAIRLPVDAGCQIERLTVELGSRAAALRQFACSLSCPPVLARYLGRTGHMPARLDGVGRLNRVPAVAYMSLTGVRLFIKLPLAARRSVAGAFVY